MKLLLLLCLVPVLGQATVMTQPEQVHLSFGATPSQMIVTWTTFDATDNSTVEYGQQRPLDKRAFGSATRFQDGGSEQRVLFIHRVVLKDLTPGTTYFYHCGSDDGGWSDVFYFTAMQEGTDWSPRLAVYGDLGNVNGKSIPHIQTDVANGMYDAILHNGDMAYNLDTDNARLGDEFMRQIQPIAAYVPYMTSVGNHESAYNFSNYVNRFSMVNSGSGEMNNHFYSFDIGPAHIIAFSSEFYFYVEYGWSQIATQYHWLEEDLRKANLPENRAKRPWIITMAHRPMYCSTDDNDDCSHKESIMRKGLPVVHSYGLEDLFYKYGVDIEFGAHEHTYERLWPVYDRKVYNGSYEEPYTNPKAPIHMLVGSAGCQEDLDNFVPDPAPWSAVRIKDYGYTRMTIHNRTHISVEQVSADQNGKITDQFKIIKKRHGPEAWR